MGATLSTHPTLAWFVPDAIIKPMEFRLYEYDAQGKPQPVGQPIQLQSSPGIMRLSLAREQLKLTVGKTYLWQVVILCDPDSPSSDLIVRSDIQVVETPLAFAQQLAQVNTGSEKVELYAGAGFWYDAMGEALQLAPPWQLGEVAASLLRDLVNLEPDETRPEIYTAELELIENTRSILRATDSRKERQK
ncbi:conserved domain protein [Coleofasciculus chthonoplastes PCC 7420]|uniref:Conserved domain protein n=1 Tax=Coleofasciculus chthonoplastes PCC 7420 TaxID=118168 RepID=B4W0Z5_9CYAN|nr:conserved domain protein [Coleofasciculus chthonoplastes PCC 7420]